MVFQPIRCTASGVATGTGELLPHLFTLSLTRGQGGHFLLHYYTLTDIFLLGSMVLCVVRTFLPPPTGGKRWISLLRCKDTKSVRNHKIATFGGDNKWSKVTKVKMRKGRKCFMYNRRQTMYEIELNEEFRYF